MLLTYCHCCFINIQDLVVVYSRRILSLKAICQNMDRLESVVRSTVCLENDSFYLKQPFFKIWQVKIRRAYISNCKIVR